jgi:hypothetical protein
MEPADLLPCSQDPGTGPYPVLDESTPHFHFIFSNTRFNILGLLVATPRSVI